MFAFHVLLPVSDSLDSLSWLNTMFYVVNSLSRPKGEGKSLSGDNLLVVEVGWRVWTRGFERMGWCCIALTLSQSFCRRVRGVLQRVSV